jgi:hypothetical protein
MGSWNPRVMVDTWKKMSLQLGDLFLTILEFQRLRPCRGVGVCSSRQMWLFNNMYTADNYGSYVCSDFSFKCRYVTMEIHRTRLRLSVCLLHWNGKRYKVYRESCRIFCEYSPLSVCYFASMALIFLIVLAKMGYSGTNYGHKTCYR